VADKPTAPWPSPQAPAPLNRHSHVPAREVSRPKICAAAVLPPSTERAPLPQVPQRRSHGTLRRVLAVVLALWGLLMVVVSLLPRGESRSVVAESTPKPQTIVAQDRTKPETLVAEPDPDVVRFAYASTCQVVLDGIATGNVWEAVAALELARAQADYFADGAVPERVADALASPDVSEQSMNAVAAECGTWSEQLTD
jgi:hypothetical protein